MPTPRSSGSSRQQRPVGRGESSARSGAAPRRARTEANDRRTPARPRGENPYKRKADGPTQSRTGRARPEASGARRSEASEGRVSNSRGTRDAPRSAGRAGRSFDDREARGRKGSYEHDRRPEPPKRKGWGSVARKGAVVVNDEGPRRSSEIEAERRERPRPAPAEWTIVRQDVPPGKKRAARAQEAEPIRLSPDAVREIEERVGAKNAPRFVRYLRDAARAYAAERWPDVRKALRPLLAEVSDAPSVQELNGMLLYRTGKWSAACKELEASHLQTLSYDLYPAIMDCRRALKQSKVIDGLWNELRGASPSPDVLAEGRIVYASFLAEQDRLQDAIRVMEKTPRPRREAKLYHLRSWYVLGDLYERAGDAGNARSWFERVAAQSPDLADVLERLDALG